MNNSFFRVNDFITEEKFDKLKDNFLSNDIHFYQPNFKPREGGNSITYFEIIETKEGTVESIDVVKYFIKDFLFSGIINIVENEIADFERYCYEKGVVTKQAKKELLNQNQSFKNELKVIEDAKYLSEEIKEVLKLSIDKLISRYKERINSNYRKIPNRLKFNWRKNKIQTLFYLLWKNDYINACKPADIGNILDFGFEYLKDEDEEKGIYVEMNDSRKELSDFSRAKGDKTPIEELQEIFSNVNFYNH